MANTSANVGAEFRYLMTLDSTYGRLDGKQTLLTRLCLGIGGKQIWLG